MTASATCGTGAGELFCDPSYPSFCAATACSSSCPYGTQAPRAVDAIAAASIGSGSGATVAGGRLALAAGATAVVQVAASQRPNVTSAVPGLSLAARLLPNSAITADARSGRCWAVTGESGSLAACAQREKGGVQISAHLEHIFSRMKRRETENERERQGKRERERRRGRERQKDTEGQGDECKLRFRPPEDMILVVVVHVPL